MTECNRYYVSASVTGVAVHGGGSRSWKRVVDQSMSAYQLSAPGSVIDYAVIANTLARTQLASNTVDYACSDNPHTPDEQLLTPDLVSLPFAAQAMVFVFNLAGVTTNKLVLSSTTVARIVMGNITKWNDPQLVSLNPSLKLPAANITLIVRTDGNVVNPVLYRGLYAASTEFAATVTASADAKTIIWPYTANLMRVASYFSLGTIMSTIPNTLSMMWLDEAALLKLPYANLQNSLGRTLVPNSDSVLFAVMERGGIPLNKATGGLADLTGVTGPTAWPFTAYSYLILRTIGFRQACAIKSAMVKFWQWFFTAQTAQDVANSLSFVIPPTQIRQSHGIDELLSTSMFCRETLVAPAKRTEQSLGIGTYLAKDLFTLYPIVYNNLATANGTIAYETSDSDDALQSLVFGEVDFATTVGELTRPDWLYESLDAATVSQLPMFISRFTLVYNLPTLSDTNNQLIVDASVLSGIFTGDIRSWDDPRIAAINPELYVAGKLPTINITRVIATAGERDAGRTFFQSLAYMTRAEPIPFNATLDADGVVLPYWSMPWLNQKDSLITQVDNENKVQAAVTNQIGAIGVTVVNSGLEATTQRVRFKKPSGDLVTEAALSAYRCTLDTFNATDLTLALYKSSRVGCWPFSTAVYSVVRSNNAASQCLNAGRALRFLSFIHDQTSVNAETAATLSAGSFTSVDDDALLASSASSSAGALLARTSTVAEGLGVLWFPPYIRARVQRRLQAITCEGETILVTLPVDHRVSQPIESAALAMTILGACVVALILCFLYFFHLRSAIKASSPLFLLATLTGILFMFISGALLTKEYPTDMTCGFGWWFVNLGFTLTFGPLFVKCWRIYKIFMRKEMTVVRLTDANLFLRLFLALTAELLFLGAMQASDPFKSQVVVQTALPRDQTIYFCAPGNATYAGILGGYKGLILLFGAMMSFSTRSVSENFNESKPIAFSIYNVLFTCCIVVPIALLQQSDGRTLYILAVFTVYWITMCTFSITFGPKVVTIYKDASGFLAQRVSDSKASASELSRNPGGRTIKELAQQPIRLMDRGTLRMYASLLEKELSMARAALATLDANEGVLAGGGGGHMTAQHQSMMRTVSGVGNTTGAGGGTGLLNRAQPNNAVGTPPGSTMRLMAGATNQAFTSNNNNSPRSRAGSVYKYPTPAPTTATGPGSARASSPNPPLTQRTASVAPIPPPPQSTPSFHSSAAELKTPTPGAGSMISPTNAMMSMMNAEGATTPFAPPQRTSSSNGITAAIGAETRFRMTNGPSSIQTTARGPLTVTVNSDVPGHGNAWRNATTTDRLAQLRAVDGSPQTPPAAAASTQD